MSRVKAGYWNCRGPHIMEIIINLKFTKVNWVKEFRRFVIVVVIRLVHIHVLDARMLFKTNPNRQSIWLVWLVLLLLLPVVVVLNDALHHRVYIIIYIFDSHFTYFVWRFLTLNTTFIYRFVCFRHFEYVHVLLLLFLLFYLPLVRLLTECMTVETMNFACVFANVSSDKIHWRVRTRITRYTNIYASH